MKRIVTLLLLILSCKIVMAQGWSISAKSGEIAFGAITYIESVYPKAGGKGADTLCSTGILLKDSNRVYLVTTKQNVQRMLAGNNQQLLNTHISITTARVNNGKIKYLRLPVLTAGKIRPYVLSSDEDDIAIISFQKRSFKPVLKALLKDEGKPLPVDSLDLSDDHYPDEDFFHPSYMVYKSKAGVKTWSKGLGTAKIKTYNDGATFVMTDYTSASSSGSPLFVHDKIIGMVKNGEGMGPNTETIRDPYKHSETAIVIKATQILPLLRQMQQIENMPGFDALRIEMKPGRSKL